MLEQVPSVPRWPLQQYLRQDEWLHQEAPVRQKSRWLMLLWPPFLAKVFPRNMQLSLAKILVPAVRGERYYFGLLRPLHGNAVGNIEQRRVFADLSILYCQEEQFAWENWSSICVHHERSYFSPHIYGRTLSSPCNLIIARMYEVG